MHGAHGRATGWSRYRLLADRLWFGDWLAHFRNQEGRFSAAPERSSLVLGLARARFGLSMAPLGIASAWRKGFGGRNLSPDEGGARLYVVNGVAREATQDLGGWKSQAVMEVVYTNVRSGEVVPEMRAAVAKACAVLEVSSFREDVHWGLGPGGDEVPSSVRGAAARVWLR